MPRLIILGSSNAIPDENHENTHMALIGKRHLVLIDCAGNPIVRLKQAGIHYGDVTDLILTHFHPDHVSGAPSFLMSSWLLGRTTPLTIYGLPHCINRIQKLMELYDWHSWPHFFPVNFQSLEEREFAVVLDNEEFTIYSSPVHHLIPTIGLRFEMKNSGRYVAYSCDTEPCEEVVRLASGADLLIHEASGKTIGHSSVSQAAMIARQAEVRKLMLIHYPTLDRNPISLVDEARAVFQGPITLAEDFVTLEL